jgi:nucleosome binding factor SPN SPT16 subunit
MGLEFREAAFQITAKNSQQVRTGMIMNIQTGFQNIPNEKKTYSMMISDTLLIGATGNLTITTASKEASEISYIFKDPAEPSSPKKLKRENPSPAKTKILPTKVRGEDVQVASNEMKRKNHQKQLAAETQQRGLIKYSGVAAPQQEAAVLFKKYESYRKETQLPKQTIGKSLEIYNSRKLQV